MDQQKPGNNRLLTLLLIVAVAAASLAFGYWIGGIFTPGKVEKIYFESCEWVDDECVLSIGNTGADELIVNKVWINDTLLDSTDWECFPSMRFEPGDQGALCIAASLAIFQQGTTYKFTLQTLAGNSFSHTAKPQASQFTWMGYESVEIQTISWTPMTGFTITVFNDGTKDVTLNHVEVNYQKKTVAQTLPTALATGDTMTLDVTFTYTNGTAYDISVITSSGYEFTDHFTGGQDVPPTATENIGVMAIRRYGTNSYFVDVKNWGTLDVTVVKVRIGGSAGNTGWKTLSDSVMIPAGASHTLDTGDVGIDFSVGATVTVTVETTFPSDFTSVLTVEG